ncbi:MAG: hypothetical protein GC190_19370 [Alphaproteobacteria bacterium]|nr:hypothetical protein [Alphaproteobacteria bacterium]
MSLPATLDVTEDAIFTALRSVLLIMLPSATVVVQGQENRVPQPANALQIVMQPGRRTRLSTNEDTSADVSFTGHISGKVLTVTEILDGVIVVGRELFGLGIPAGTQITAFVSGTPGGVGIYSVNNSLEIASEKMAAGAMAIVQHTEFPVQIDVYGDTSGDVAQIISTLMRDEYAIEQFEAVNPSVVPLYSDDPIEATFEDENKQVQRRWAVMTYLQVNPQVSVPQQFADELDVEPISVSATYPIS